ncbi:MAG: hypothetical protein WED10_03935 [Brumimicrobium sp.]
MNKQEMKTDFKTKIDEAYRDILELENKSKKASGEMKKQLDKRIDKLQAKKDQMDSFYEELLNSSEEKAKEVKIKLDKSMVGFREGFKEVAEIF